MATIGYRKQGALAQTAKLWIRGLLVPVGVPSATYSDQVAWGAWPDPLSGLEADLISAPWSMYLTDDGAGLVSKATACVSWCGGFGTAFEHWAPYGADDRCAFPGCDGK